MKKGVLYLVPNTLGSDKTDLTIPVDVKKIIAGLKYFIVENEKSARHFLKTLDAGIIQQDLKISVIDKHNHETSYAENIQLLLEGNSIGLISEAGCPGIADPGADIVQSAHKENIRVIPLTGPSSLLLALMASGLNGQSFCFHGYLPKEKEQCKIKIRQLEKKSFQKNQTQIFIETPYRNMQMLRTLVSECELSTLLCIACDITLDSEMISTKIISEWRKNLPDINKRPAVFLLLKK